MYRESFVLRKEKNFLRALGVGYFITLSIFLLLYFYGNPPTGKITDMLLASFIVIIIGGPLMWCAIRPLTPLTMVIDWQRRILLLSDRKDSSVSLRFDEIKKIVYKGGIFVRDINDNTYNFSSTINIDDKDSLLSAIERINEIIEKKEITAPKEG